MFGKATSLTAIALGAFAVGCEDPTATTDLRPEGEPEVLSVLVMNDPGLFLETATFCKPNDAKRPAFVGFIGGNVCDDDLAQPAGFRDPDGNFVEAKVEDAVPTDWYIRIMFDELLDPNTEELIPILDPVTMVETGLFTGSLLNTQPVTVTCGGNVVAYDGYYSPSGNAVTWPVGPSLFVKPIDPSTVATSSACTVQIKDSLLDKDGLTVPAAQNGSDGLYGWSIAPLTFAGSAPAPAGAPGEEEVITPDAPVVVSFNAFIDAATLAAAEVTVKEVPIDVATGAPICDDAGTAKTAVIAADAADPLSLNISIAGVNQANCTGCVFDAEKAYVITFSDTNEVADVAGGTGALPGAADFTLCFLTDVAP